MKKTVLSLLLASLCILVNAQNWTGKYKLVEDPNDGKSFILQVVPDGNGTSRITASGTVAYIVIPFGIDYTAEDINGTWTTTTSPLVPSGGSNCGQLVQSTMESDYDPGTFTAGVPVDLVRYTLTDVSVCTEGLSFRIMEDNVSGNEPCDGIDAGSLDNGLQIASNSDSYTGNLTDFNDPLTCELVLPVELTSFDVEKTGETSLVSWTTATEINNDFFNVERSKDGVHFETIATVDGNGTTTDRINYSYEDTNPMSGVNYYRLKQVDYDGAYEYSQIKSVRFDGKMGVNVTMGLYPNPANDHVTVELDGIKLDTKTTVRVFDKIGKLVMVTDMNANNQVDISELVDGMYMIQAINNDAIIATKKLVKASSF